MLVAFVGLVIACGTAELSGDDSPAREEGARVEVNGGHGHDARVEIKNDRSPAVRVEIVSDSKDSLVQINGDRRKASRVETVSDSKDSLVEINSARRDGAAIEVNGRRARAHWRFGGRYLFGQEQAQVEDPPLPPSQFNPDPGGGNLLEPEPPPDLFPPILPQPPEYGEESVPRSLGLPRRGVRESSPERHKLDYEAYPDSETGAGMLPGAEPVPNRWFIGFGRWKRYADPSAKRLINPARCASGIRICKASSKATRPSSARTFSSTSR